MLIIYLMLAALMVLDICLFAICKMSFAGYWSDRVVFWLWFIATPFVVFCFWKNLAAKIYFWTLVAATIVSMIPMGIFFFGILLSTTGSGRLNHFSLKNNIRVQTVGYGVMGRPRLQVIEDNLLFDKILLEKGDEVVINDSTTLNIRDAISANLIRKTDTSILVKYLFEKDSVQTVHQFEK